MADNQPEADSHNTVSMWPPLNIDANSISRVVFFADGKGVELVCSTAATLQTLARNTSVTIFFTTRVSSSDTLSSILHLNTLLNHTSTSTNNTTFNDNNTFNLRLYFDGHPSRALMDSVRTGTTVFEPRRLLRGDVLSVFEDKEGNEKSVVYVFMKGDVVAAGQVLSLVKECEGIGEDRIVSG